MKEGPGKTFSYFNGYCTHEDFFKIMLDRAESEIERGNEDHRLRYELVTCYATRGNKDEAYKWLQQAIDLGFLQHHFAQADPALEDLYQDVQFIEMMSDLENRLEELRSNVNKMDN